jgi:hypothetical protein
VHLSATLKGALDVELMKVAMLRLSRTYLAKWKTFSEEAVPEVPIFNIFAKSALLGRCVGPVHLTGNLRVSFDDLGAFDAVTKQHRYIYVLVVSCSAYFPSIGEYLEDFVQRYPESASEFPLELAIPERLYQFSRHTVPKISAHLTDAEPSTQAFQHSVRDSDVQGAGLADGIIALVAVAEPESPTSVSWPSDDEERQVVSANVGAASTVNRITSTSIANSRPTRRRRNN